MEKTINNWFCKWNMLKTGLVALVSVGCLSCGNNNDGDISDSDLIQALQINKWITRDASSGEGTGSHAWVDLETTILYFTTSNSGISYWIQKDYDSDLGNSTTKDYSLFEYFVSDNSVTLYFENSYNTTLYFQSGYLVSESGSTIYEPSQMSSSDYEFVRSLGPQSGTSGGITFTYDPRAKKLIISGNGNMQNYKVGTQPWADYDIYSVEVEEGITSIGDNAFYNMYISEVDLPSSLKRIGKQAFANTLLKEVYIPSSVEEVCEAAFAGCNYLTTINFDYDSNENSSLKIIGDLAFSGCKIKQYMRFTNQLENIGMMAFSGSFSIVHLGKNIRSIGYGAFSSSASRGSFYINRETPPSETSLVLGINDELSNDIWSLHVPVGCKSNYSSKEPWNKFKYIFEYNF